MAVRLSRAVPSDWRNSPRSSQPPTRRPPGGNPPFCKSAFPDGQRNPVIAASKTGAQRPITLDLPAGAYQFIGMRGRRPARPSPVWGTNRSRNRRPPDGPRASGDRTRVSSRRLEVLDQPKEAKTVSRGGWGGFRPRYRCGVRPKERILRTYGKRSPGAAACRIG